MNTNLNTEPSKEYKCDILETTLRDGSYAIDFKFTAKDTAMIASLLEQVGFRWIEIGHGLGLHGKEMGKGDAACTDEEYLKVAASVLTRAKFGMFCIPGIARLEDIDMAASLGMSFIRIGTNITELEGTQAYFERAKKHGLYVSSNLMKSYAVAPAEFGKYTKLAQQYGSDIVALVDSAGGLFPRDIEAYFKSSRDACDVALGYHGHNNLGLANANTLRAVEMGAILVDTSLKGMGRSAGNAVTEMMVMILKKMGVNLDIDEYKTMDIAEKYIDPLLHDVKHTPISITGGYADFHSSFLGTIMKYSEKYKVDPRELIVRVTDKDKVHAPETLVENMAEAIKSEKKEITSTRLNFGKYSELKDSWKKNSKDHLRILADEVVTEAKKKGKKSVFNIVMSDPEEKSDAVSDFIQESAYAIVGSMMAWDYEYMMELYPAIKGKYDYILLDSMIYHEDNRKKLVKLIEFMKEERLLMYHDLDLWSKSIASMLNVILGGVAGKKAVIKGKNRLVNAIVRYMGDIGGRFCYSNLMERELPEDKDDYEIIISCCAKTKLNEADVRGFRNIKWVIDARIGSIEPECIEYLHKRGIQLIRPDMRSVIAGEILHQVVNYNRVHNDLGRERIGDFTIVSGGLIGKKGEIVVDSLRSSSRIIGVARGDGTVDYDYDPSLQEILGRLEKEEPWKTS